MQADLLGHVLHLAVEEEFYQGLARAGLAQEAKYVFDMVHDERKFIVIFVFDEPLKRPHEFFQ